MGYWMISDDSIERKPLRVMDDIRMILLKENPSGVMDVFGLFY